ncbi:MAG: ribonuclease HII [Candidatus Kapabacteria bacterium]|nr:ribonuclease HII [Candidatus Kapabacteria bacterium]
MHFFEYEQSLYGRGLTIIGVDEAGRGALAGPVVAAAVVLDMRTIPAGIDDSKKLRPQQRSQLDTAIKASAIAWAVGWCSSGHIDEVNILQATFDAMHKAVNDCIRKVDQPPEMCHLLIDGNRFRPHAAPHTTVVHGDALCVSIAAASILAKVHRDTVMAGEVDRMYPAYGFARHKGYGTSVHRKAIAMHGPCPEHRRTFISGIETPGDNQFDDRR